MMEYRVKQLLNSKLVPALLSVVLGIVIIIARRAALDVLVPVIGALVIGSGAGFVLLYLTRPNKEAGNLKMVLTLAALAVLTGIVLISFAGHVAEFFPIIVGLALVLNGLSHMAAAWSDPDSRLIVAAAGLAPVVAGIFIILQPGFIASMFMVFVGAAMIVNGLTDLLVVKTVRGALPA